MKVFISSVIRGLEESRLAAAAGCRTLAAKTRWILDDSGSPMTPTGIATAAGRFDWNVTDVDVENASAFLQALGLVEGVAAPASSCR